MPAPFPWVFPYHDDPVVAGEPRFGQPVVRPLVEVRLAGYELSERVFALIDSGSEHTLASRWVAQAMGVEPDDNRSIVLGLGGQNIRVEFADARIRLGPPGTAESDWIEWQTEIGFVRQWRATWPVLLGQRGFFDQFTVTMNRLARAVALTSKEEFDERFPPEPVTEAPNPPPRFRP